MPKGAKLPFKTFPEFTKLTMEHREAYNSIISRYPPCSNITFGSLMTWWSALDTPLVALHGENLIISLWYPGYDDYSGLCVLGVRNVDETICSVFDYQQSLGREPRVSHIPEFVVSKIRFPEMFEFQSMRDHDECIVSVDVLADPTALPEHKRWKLNRFLSEFNEQRIEVRNLDLTSVYDKDVMLEKLEQWRSKGGVNSFAKHDEDCLVRAIRKGPELGYYAAGMFVDGELEAYLVMHESQLDGYELITYARFSYNFPYFLEIVTYTFAKWFKANGTKEVNIESDSGFPVLRQLKLSMGPSNFIRMYKVSPIVKKK